MSKFWPAIPSKYKTATAAAICDRCGLHCTWDELQEDPNKPGIKVCQRRGCYDDYSFLTRGYTTTAENLALPFTRPPPHLTLPGDE